jgi:murein L,D-transpeptidase YcbB/YkuD
MHIPRFYFYFFIFFLASFVCCTQKDDKKIPVVHISNEAVALDDTTASFFTAISLRDSSLQSKIIAQSRDFYRQMNWKTKWLNKLEPTETALSFLKEARRARYYGLKPETYQADSLLYRLQRLYQAEMPEQKSLQALDRDLTAAFLLFTAHLHNGRITPHNSGRKLWLDEHHQHIGQNKDLLLSLDEEVKMESVLDTIHPPHTYYLDLRNKLREVIDEKARDIKEFEGFEEIARFKPGFEDERVGKIRHNLNQWSVPVALDTNLNINVVDDSLVQSIRIFQESRHIKADGMPGHNTLLYLNMTHDQLIELISLNLERMRWLNENFGHKYILVNVPEYMLRVYEENEVVMKMRIIVGKPENPTPIFSDTLKYLVFRPTWTIPQSIIKKEMIPVLAKDPWHYSSEFYLKEGDNLINPASIDWKDSSVYNRYFHFVQKPGPSNALGLVKFIMPNKLSIYLHDTPNHQLFLQEDRCLSHGCIRLDKPGLLATYLLRDVEGWDQEKVQKAMSEGGTRQVNLKTDYHVQIAYFTTWVNEEGELKIAEDIYGHDRLQLKELNNLH